MAKSCYRILLSVTSILLCVQCGIAEYEVVMTDVDSHNWEDSATITYENSDTEQSRSLAIMLHVNRQFEADGVELEITTFTPDSLRYSEKVALPVDIVWPNRVVDATDVELPYRRGVNLRHKGEYKITITPRQPIKGVVAAGINFKSQK